LHFGIGGVKFFIEIVYFGADSMEPESKKEQNTETCSDRKEDQKSTINFSSFLLSLSTQTFISLGEMKNPVTGETGVNLDAAKQLIDIICMLQERTKGNLEPEEKKLLENILYDVRLKYIEKSKQEEK
jgi:hypothetical protein